MYDVYLLSYNTYYNRLLKRRGTLAGYQDYILPPMPGDANPIMTASFNPRDGVYTSYVVNWRGTAPDYVLITESGDAQILTRWYVTDAIRERQGQYTLRLYRDLLADYLDEISSATVYVEKGTLDASDPFIFNREAMTLNQIRKSSTPISDSTGTPWVVGYIPADSFTDGPVDITKTVKGADVPDLSVEDLSSWPLYQYVHDSDPGPAAPLMQTATLKVVPCVRIYTPPGKIYNYSWSASTYVARMAIGRGGPVSLYTATGYPYSVTYTKSGTGGYISPSTEQDALRIAEAMRETYSTGTSAASSFWASLDSAWGTEPDLTVVEALRGADGKVLEDLSTGITYKIRLVTPLAGEEHRLGDYPEAAAAYSAMLPAVDGYVGPTVTGDIILDANTRRGYLTLQQLTETVTVSIPQASARPHLIDSPYDMFAIPYMDGTVYDDGAPIQISKASGLSVAQAIATTAGRDNVYDVQILPFCPIPGIVVDGRIRVDKYPSIPIYQRLEGDLRRQTSVAFFATITKFVVDIDMEVPEIQDAIEKKVESQATVYRFTSPNFASFFDFDPQKNGGIHGLRAYCSYRPFNPFIRLAPNFGGLYGGGDLQYDARGLIMAGDFSVAQVTAAWADYQLRNKNYQAVFDRQMQHLEIHQGAERIQQVTGAISGVLSAATSGAQSGAMGGGGIGAIVGGVVGAAGSTLGAALDYQIQESLRNEAIDYAKDQFGYSLGNIQALPQGISKTDAQGVDNPLLPLLEIYTCTPEEKEALRDKIRYNGMTVMRISEASQFIGRDGYFKAQLIRLEGIGDDHHIVNSISAELNKGVYIYVSNVV